LYRFQKVKQSHNKGRLSSTKYSGYLDKLRRARYFTALDCASRYLQVPIASEVRHKITSSTVEGHLD
jgi:hypothetical protein